MAIVVVFVAQFVRLSSRRCLLLLFFSLLSSSDFAFNSSSGEYALLPREVSTWKIELSPIYFLLFQVKNTEQSVEF